MENEKAEREAGWAEGVHISTNGRRTPITEMDDRHLNNSIKKYGAEGMGWDVSALEAEALRRKQNEQA